MAAANRVFARKVMPVAGGLRMRDGAGAIMGSVGFTGNTPANDALAGEAGIRAAGYLPYGVSVLH